MNLIFTIVEIKGSFSVHVLRMQSSYAMVAYIQCVCVVSKAKSYLFYYVYELHYINAFNNVLYMGR